MAVFKKAIQANQTTFALIRDVRTLESGNLVLVFDEAEVVMPGTWRLRHDLDDCTPTAAWWDEQGGFHLEWEDEA